MQNNAKIEWALEKFAMLEIEQKWRLQAPPWSKAKYVDQSEHVIQAHTDQRAHKQVQPTQDKAGTPTT